MDEQLEKLILEKLNSMEKSIFLIQEDVGVLKTDVGTLKSDVQTLKTDVKTLKSDVQTLKSGQASLERWAIRFEYEVMEKLNILIEADKIREEKLAQYDLILQRHEKLLEKHSLLLS